MKVQDPSGQTWRITRRWLPWRRRAQNIDTSDFSGFDLADGADDPISIVLFLVVGILFFPIILLGLLVAAELFLLLLLLPVAVLARAAFGKQWTIEARRGFSIVWDAPAGDWQASGLRIHEVADAVRRGELPGAHPGAAATSPR